MTSSPARRHRRPGRATPRTRVRSDADYAALCMCNCARLPSGHPAGQCASLRTRQTGATS